MNERILEIKDLRTSFFTHFGEVQAIRGISFHIDKGETVGLVGESGSGKSVTSLSVMGLLQFPGRIVDGQILYKGQDLIGKPEKEMRHIRGNEISMIFQDPMTSLNPVFTVGNQIVEAIRNHQKIDKKQAEKKAIEMLDLVGIPSPEKRIKNYPHEFSGGMRQRAMIAMALSCEPSLLMADEPTTALDVTIQSQILRLMKDLKDRVDTSILLITHDLGVVAEVCHRVIVMYGGLIMEEGLASEVFYQPKHPYTQGLMQSIPHLASGQLKERLIPIQGTPPDLLHPPVGCPFADRCKYAMKLCNRELPSYFQLTESHRSLCWLLHEDAPDTGWNKGGAKHE